MVWIAHLKTTHSSGPVFLDISLIRKDIRRILVLQSYVTMFDHIWAQGFSSYGSKGAIVTGQPGTGMWQVFPLMVHNLSFKARRYLLARLLQLKQVILFSVDEEILLFYHGSVHRAKRDQITSSDLPEPRHLGIFTRTSLLHDRCSTFTSADSVT